MMGCSPVTNPTPYPLVNSKKSSISGHLNWLQLRGIRTTEAFQQAGPRMDRRAVVLKANSGCPFFEPEFKINGVSRGGIK